MKILNLVAIVLALAGIIGSASLVVLHERSLYVEQIAQDGTTVMPANAIVVGNHWVLPGESLECGQGPICDLSAGYEIDISPAAEAGDHGILAMSEEETSQMRSAISEALVQAIEQEQ